MQELERCLLSSPYIPRSPCSRMQTFIYIYIYTESEREREREREKETDTKKEREREREKARERERERETERGKGRGRGQAGRKGGSLACLTTLFYSASLSFRATRASSS